MTKVTSYPTAEILNDYWGYVYKLSHRGQHKVFVGSHATDHDEHPDFFFGGNEAVEEAGLENFDRSILKLVSSREEALLEEVAAIVFALKANDDTYHDEFGATSTGHQVIFDHFGTHYPALLFECFIDLSLEERESLLLKIRATFNPEPVEEPELEISSLSMPKAQVPE